MSKLKSLLEGMGFENVRTYIQSGNVVFQSATEVGPEDAARISCSVKAKHGFEPTVLMLSKSDLLDAEPEVADSMLTWMHSGFSVDDSVWLPDGDTHGHDRLARYCARNPLALERMRYDPDTSSVAYTSDKSCGPTSGTRTFDALDFLALVVAQIPDKGQVMQRYYGYYSNRQRGKRRDAEEASTEQDSSDARGSPPDLAPAAMSNRAIRLRWADLLRRIYEVDPLQCPACGAEMRIIACLLQPSVIDRILAHIREKGRDPRAGPWEPAAASSPHGT